MKQSFTFIQVLVSTLIINLAHAQAEGTFAAPKISDISVYGNKDTIIRRVVFSYVSDAEKTVGTKTSVYFTLNSPVKEVWPIFQNFNLWQNHKGYFYSGAFGDRENELEYLMLGPRENASIDNTQAFTVKQVIPEQLIVLHAPAWEQADAKGKLVGSRHEGKHAFMLTEVNGKTVITAAMEHSFHYAGPNAKKRAKAGLMQKIKTAQERKKKGSKDIWETAFIPKLKELLETEN
jgi:hypothetical protein